MALRNMCLLLFHPAKTHETVNRVSANMLSLLITLPAPDAAMAKPNLTSFVFMYISICVQGLNEFLEFF